MSAVAFYADSLTLIRNALFGFQRTDNTVEYEWLLGSSYSDSLNNLIPGETFVQVRCWQQEESAPDSNAIYPVAGLECLVLRSILSADDEALYAEDMLRQQADLLKVSDWRDLASVSYLLTQPSIPNAPEMRGNVLSYTMNLTAQLNADA